MKTLIYAAPAVKGLIFKDRGNIHSKLERKKFPFQTLHLILMQIFCIVYKMFLDFSLVLVVIILGYEY